MKIKKRQLTANLIFGSIFFICVLLARFKVFSYISILFFFFYFVYYCILKNKEFFFKYLAVLFISGMAILGTALIEIDEGIHLVELDCYSSFAGSLPLLIFGYWLLLFVITLVDYKYNVRISYESIAELKKYKKLYNIISIVVLVLFLLLFSKVATRPALLLGIDRFAYASQYSQLGVLGKVATNAPLLLVFPILTTIYNENFQRVIGILGIITYILYFLWIGNKFGPFFTLICIFLLIYYKKILNKGKKFIKKILIISFTAFGIILAFTIIFSISTSSYSGLEYLEQRGTQQGQLWWKTYEICENVHPMEFINEIKALGNGKDTISDNVGSDNGIYKIMYLCAPKNQVDFKLATGSRYSEAGYATMYYYFGKIGVIMFSCIMGMLIAVTINFIIRALNRGDYIKTLILLRFFLLERGSISMFLFNDFVGIISIISYVYLLLMKGKKIVINKKDGIRLIIVKC